MEPCEMNGLRKAVLLLEQYTALGTPEELRSLRARAIQLKTESDALRSELAEKSAAVDRLNRRIEYIQANTRERSRIW